MHSFWSDRLAVVTPVVQRAVERGEVPTDTDATVVVEALVGPIWLRLLLTGEPIHDEFADRVAALVSAGATRPDG